MRKSVFIFVCIYIFVINIIIAEEKAFLPIILSLPDINWALEIKVNGFSMKEFKYSNDGNAVRFLASNEETDVIMSGFLEKAPSKGDEKECREYYWSKAKNSPLSKTDIKISESGNMALVEYLVKEYMGENINQKHINAYLSKSGYWIDIHLSKIGYNPIDQKLFDDVLNEVKIIENYKPDSLMLFNYGNLFYLKNNFSKAIPYYLEAQKLENENKALPKHIRLVLVDQLGLSYGISGDIENAIKTYNNAILNEPEYPKFYYNLACAYAESDNLDESLKNLQLAFKYKNNMIPGEKFPNPKNDSSFKKYIDNDKFKLIIDQI